MRIQPYLDTITGRIFQTTTSGKVSSAHAIAIVQERLLLNRYPRNDLLVSFFPSLSFTFLRRSAVPFISFSK